MKWKTILSEYGYLAVMGLCLACSAALLISVTTDRPIVAIAAEHVPVLRTQRTQIQAEHQQEMSEAAAEPQATAEAEPQETLAETRETVLITEENLEGKLADYLPDHFPAEDLDVSFENGLLRLSFDMDRADLKAYLRKQGMELGIKRDLLLQMLPRRVELEAAFSLTADENGLHLTPVSLLAGEKTFSLDGLPQNLFAAIDSGLNRLLADAGIRFSTAEFTEDGLLLK